MAPGNLTSMKSQFRSVTYRFALHGRWLRFGRLAAHVCFPHSGVPVYVESKCKAEPLFRPSAALVQRNADFVLSLSRIEGSLPATCGDTRCDGLRGDVHDHF